MERREVNMKNANKIALVAILVILVAVAAIYYFMPSRSGDVGEGMLPGQTGPAGGPAAMEEIEPIEVDLNESDALVRKLAEALSSYPSITRWLATDGVLRRFVTAVDLIAKGESPRRPMNSVDIAGEFQTLDMDGKAFLDQAGYRRYDRVAAAISSLDARGCARLYRQLRIPMDQAYREMGYPEGDFDATMKKALLNLLATPVVDGTIYLEKDVLTFRMTDPNLESLNPAQKHLLRMGPGNEQAIQAKLREIAQYLGY